MKRIGLAFAVVMSFAGTAAFQEYDVYGGWRGMKFEPREYFLCQPTRWHLVAGHAKGERFLLEGDRHLPLSRGHGAGCWLCSVWEGDASQVWLGGQSGNR